MALLGRLPVQLRRLRQVDLHAQAERVAEAQGELRTEFCLAACPYSCAAFVKSFSTP
jgi:hypothetical protein